MPEIPTGIRPHSNVGDAARIAGALVIVVCLSSGPFVALARWVDREPLAPNTWPFRATYWGAAILGFVWFAVDVAAPLLTRRVAARPVMLAGLAAAAALAGWAVLSIAWTDSPDQTREHAVLMALVVATAVWFGFSLTYRQRVIALFGAFQGLTLVSVVAALALSSARFGEDGPDQGTWMGVFGNPNTLSPVAGLAIVSALGLLTVVRHESLPLALTVFVVVDLLAVWKADSVTGWIALVGSMVAAGAVVLAGRLANAEVPLDRVRSVGFAIVAVVVVTIPWTIRIVARIVGKRTLGGRTAIWDYVLEVSKHRRFAGYGFQSFWDNEAHRIELGQRHQFTTVPDAAHSTFLEVLLYLGVIGLVLLVVLVAISLGRTWWSALGRPDWASTFAVAVVTFALLENVTESMITYHSVFWLLLIAPALARGSDWPAARW